MNSLGGVLVGPISGSGLGSTSPQAWTFDSGSTLISIWGLGVIRGTYFGVTENFWIDIFGSYKLRKV